MKTKVIKSMELYGHLEHFDNNKVGHFVFVVDESEEKSDIGKAVPFRPFPKNIIPIEPAEETNETSDI